MVPNARPMSQCASAIGFTIARISSGVASVVKSRSLVPRPRNASRTGPPTRASSWPAGVERRRRAVATVGEAGQLAQPVEGRRDTLHAPYVKRRPRARRSSADPARARCGRRADARSPRRRIACMVAESNPARRPRRLLHPTPARRTRWSSRAWSARCSGACRCAARRERGVDPTAGCSPCRDADRRADRMPRAACRVGHAGRRRRGRRASRAGLAHHRHDDLVDGARGDLGRDRERHGEAARRGHAASASCARTARSTTTPAARRRGSSPTSRTATRHPATVVGDRRERVAQPRRRGRDRGRRSPCRARRSPTWPYSAVVGVAAELEVDGEGLLATGTGAFARAPRLRRPHAVGPGPCVPADGARPSRRDCSRPTASRSGRLRRACSPGSSTPSAAVAWRSGSIPASSRRSVCSARCPAPAVAWLERLARCRTRYSPSRTPMRTSRCRPRRAPGPLTPTSFGDRSTRPFHRRRQWRRQVTVGDATEGAHPRPPDARAGADHRALLEWPYTRTDIAWPADATVAAGNLALFAGAGLTTSILDAGNVEPLRHLAGAVDDRRLDGRGRRCPHHRAMRRPRRRRPRPNGAAAAGRARRRTRPSKPAGSPDRARHVRPREQGGGRARPGDRRRNRRSAVGDPRH